MTRWQAITNIIELFVKDGRPGYALVVALTYLGAISLIPAAAIILSSDFVPEFVERLVHDED